MMNLYICILAFAAMALAANTDFNQVLRRSNDKFTASFFSEVAQRNPGKSVVMSAFSVLPPLAQLALASVGPSHDELLRATGLPNNVVIKSVFSDLNQRLRSIKGVEFKMANRIYIDTRAQLNDNFAAVSKEVFDSDVKNVDFGKNTETANAINAWVEEKTNNKIKDLVDPTTLSSDTRAVLVNAIYFKGSWKNKFDQRATIDRDFHVTKDTTVKVPTMHIEGEFKYGESAALDAKLLELPYEGEESSFLIVLPNRIDGIIDLRVKLRDSSVLDNAIEGMYTLDVNVAVPKFKIETSINLKKVLEKMNINKLFSPSEAHLDNLLKDESDLFISEAIQKAFIEVNEEGSEAAAANVFGVPYSDSEQRDFFANRPFVFYLRDRNIILFNGEYRS